MYIFTYLTTDHLVVCVLPLISTNYLSGIRPQSLRGHLRKQKQEQKQQCHWSKSSVHLIPTLIFPQTTPAAPLQ